MEVIKIGQKALLSAIEIIKNGGVIISPTDTVYGLLCDSANKKAVEKIFKIKKRPKTKPLAVFVKDFKMAKDLAEIDERQEKILRKHWPGKYTFILKSKLLAKNGTIGIRIPRYKFLNDLLKKTGKPLAQTSANISGKPPITEINDILNNIATSNVAINLIIDGGDLPKSKPSKVIDLTSKILTRLR